MVIRTLSRIRKNPQKSPSFLSISTRSKTLSTPSWISLPASLSLTRGRWLQRKKKSVSSAAPASEIAETAWSSSDKAADESSVKEEATPPSHVTRSKSKLSIKGLISSPGKPSRSHSAERSQTTSGLQSQQYYSPSCPTLPNYHRPSISPASTPASSSSHGTKPDGQLTSSELVLKTRRAQKLAKLLGTNVVVD